MVRRVVAVALGLVSVFFFAWMADSLLQAVFAPQGYLPTLLVTFPLAVFVGAVVTAIRARDDARAAGTVYTFAYNSWLAVPLFTLLDRPHLVVAVCVLLVNIGAAVSGGLIARYLISRSYKTPLGQQRPTNAGANRGDANPFRRGLRLVFGTIFGCYFLWLSFDYASFWLGVLAVASYAIGRSALEVGEGPELIVRHRLFGRVLGYLDKFAFACAIGVIVRTSASQTYQTNTRLADESRSGRTTRLDALEPEVKARLLDQHDEYQQVKRMYLDTNPGSPLSKFGAAAMLACADGGNPHCQVIMGMCYRQGEGVERDLEKARHYTWLALRDAHHPIAFNNMLVFVHEAAPEPYSELLNKTQDPETIDRVRAGCAK